MSTNDKLNWFKSSYSGSEGDSCVEVARRPDAVHVRDSKEKDGPRFAVSQAAWVAFIEFAGV
ncbi:DUF397 domain-containing protein [Streptomyces sp. NBC_00879]|uniref:DUF397 domain-containing protein n=1 Tax=Streptomyces sp. NBC_00879 TaxID=2975855 RepID=UPI003866DF09|nr:DUF397 domain-containing protein [Streptomyces sp. NBC_00879]